jgi:aminomuconate-semialdehyde/2-hydroxymuconate-6-semialdehyde dehydrogenase
MDVAHWIGGKAAAPSGGRWLDDVDPKTGAVFARVARGDAADVDAAVAAAQSAPVLPVAERAALLERVADAIEARLEEFAEAEARDSGKPLALTRGGDVPRGLDNLRFFASAIRSGETAFHAMEGGFNYTLRQPLGVVATITPWNFPFHLFTWKVAPAIAMGNAVVAKPSELTPTTATMTAEVFSLCGAPPGLLNVVHGVGGEAGEALVNHPFVKAISFTGSTAAGRRIAGAAAPALKKVSLELGGKNPTVVFADADFDAALAGAARAAFFNTGQVCLCGSRLLVERSIAARFTDALVKESAKWMPPDGLGALVSAAHRDKVESYVKLAQSEGGTIAVGGRRLPPEGGCYFATTVITGLDACARAAQEEIFGPVVSVTSFEDEADAIAIANDTLYGLGAGVWTRDQGTAFRAGRAIQAGRVWTNCYHHYPAHAAFGGYKHSGIGRENHRMMLDHYRQTKNLLVSYDPNPMGFF